MSKRAQARDEVLDTPWKCPRCGAVQGYISPQLDEVRLRRDDLYISLVDPELVMIPCAECAARVWYTKIHPSEQSKLLDETSFQDAEPVKCGVCSNTLGFLNESNGVKILRVRRKSLYLFAVNAKMMSTFCRRCGAPNDCVLMEKRKRS